MEKKLETLISVIMLTYNRQHLVARAIEAILQQTFREYEFIIVDNGSTDNSGAICEQYARKDPRIKTIHCPRGSIGSRRNVGLDAANGEYIAFIDDDDWCDRDYLESLYQMILDNEADVSICAVEKEENGKKTFVGIPEEILVMDAEESIITLMWRKYYSTGFPAKLFRANLFQGIRFLDKEKYDDISIMYKVLASADKVVYKGISKYHVYRHEGNNSVITTNDYLLSTEYLQDYRKAYRDRTNWLCARFPENEAYWWYFDLSFLLSMTRKIIVNHIDECGMHLNEMLKELRKNKEELLNCTYLQDYEREWLKEFVK